MRTFRTSTVIHGFAALHVAAAVLCRLMGVNDELILTTLTILLTVILCLRYRQSVEFSATVIIITNIAGYLLGNGIAALAGTLVGHPVLSPAIATFTTTELMGWGLVLFMRRFAVKEKKSSVEYRWLAFAITAILLARIVISAFGSSLLAGGSVLGSLSSFSSDSLTLLLMVCLTVVFVEYQKRLGKDCGTAARAATIAAFFLASSALCALLVGSGLPFHFRSLPSARKFLELLFIALILEALVYSVVYLIEYALSARRSAEREKDRADLAKYQYLNLKQQVNPHFLFNSLNILDALVLDGSREEASEYIHKLAGIYRYMLRNEEESIVTLRDEMTYVGMYRDLLKVRFQNGFEVEVDIPEADLSRHVVPCSVQLLIENATKHNAIEGEKPLKIRVFSDGSILTVTNNLIPKINEAPSSGLGLNYIRQQYKERAGRGIEIARTDGSYTVKLPLI
jgi:two-component system, LytTR family, sensor kinase